MKQPSHWLTLVATMSLAAHGGCAVSSPPNASFSLTSSEAIAAIQKMRLSPAPLQRPVIVLGGLYDRGSGAKAIARELQQVFDHDDHVLMVHFSGALDFEACAQRLIDAVECEFANSSAGETVEVDVVAHSMGGLVARHAASHRLVGALSRKRLNLVRLFTISTPHQGARLAFRQDLDPRIDDMCLGSGFLESLNAEPRDYEIVAYTRLDDHVVGEEHAAPPGVSLWWVPNEPLRSAHTQAKTDSRILADIARRLRNETPFSTDPAAPLPPRRLGVRSIAFSK